MILLRRMIAVPMSALAIAFWTTPCVGAIEQENWVLSQLQQRGYADFHEINPKVSGEISGAFLGQLLGDQYNVPLPPLLKLYHIRVVGDVVVDARVISRHWYVCGGEFTGRFDLHHVTTNGSFEICNSSFAGVLSFSGSDFAGGLRFANNFFEQGFAADECTFSKQVRFVGQGSRPSKSIVFQDVTIGALNLTNCSIDHLLLSSIECSSVSVSDVRLKSLRALKLNASRRLSLSGTTIQPGTESEKKPSTADIADDQYDFLLSEVFVGTTARLTNNKLYGKVAVRDFAATSVASFEGSQFLSTVSPARFTGLSCNAGCSFDATAFNVAPQLHRVSVADQLSFRDSAISGGGTLSVSESLVNGTATFVWKNPPAKISFRESSFNVLSLPAPSTANIDYEMEEMNVRRISMPVNAPKEWVSLMRHSSYLEPFSSRLISSLSEEGQPKSADAVRVALLKRKKESLAPFLKVKDDVYEFVLQYGTKPWAGLWIAPLTIFLFGLFLYRKQSMTYTGISVEPFYLSFVYTGSKMVPFFYIPELEGWRPRTRLGLVYLLLFPVAQLSLAVLAAHYALDKI